ncbi:MAG: hypothetical protein GXP42_12930 [Chloroflexi bacterium]|nr:hypothetical protein [Chloroflexota bacterium]
MSKRRRKKRKTNKALKEAFLSAVDEQLRSGESPETRQTYERLLAAGYSDEDARTLIAHVLVSEIYHVLRSRKPYNRERYIGALNRLPALPRE